ncbi:zinc finger ZZ-type and EF-hand domain-containing protein 1 isoform X2 [Petromyzon marinus]|uniref:Zinc finger ZZ-type and EF-hand domain-containing protein 1 n=1 Tax=Petromyzon marinus TaxID=7757 RepID=A0AAJ7UCZ9_PETMA|nr:zinc finger ZZ-type and EF-hand domain-containing protein 1 [Petromyzon marinus]
MGSSESALTARADSRRPRCRRSSRRCVWQRGPGQWGDAAKGEDDEAASPAAFPALDTNLARRALRLKDASGLRGGRPVSQQLLFAMGREYGVRNLLDEALGRGRVSLPLREILGRCRSVELDRVQLRDVEEALSSFDLELEGRVDIQALYGAMMMAYETTSLGEKERAIAMLSRASFSTGLVDVYGKDCTTTFREELVGRMAQALWQHRVPGDHVAPRGPGSQWAPATAAETLWLVRSTLVQETLAQAELDQAEVDAWAKLMEGDGDDASTAGAGRRRRLLTQCFSRLEASCNNLTLENLTDGTLQTFWQTEHSLSIGMWPWPGVVITRLALGVLAGDGSSIPAKVEVLAGRPGRLEPIISTLVPFASTGYVELLQGKEISAEVVKLEMVQNSFPEGRMRVRGLLVGGHVRGPGPLSTAIEAVTAHCVVTLALQASQSAEQSVDAAHALATQLSSALRQLPPLALLPAMDLAPNDAVASALHRLGELLGTLHRRRPDGEVKLDVLALALARGNVAHALQALALVVQSERQEYDAGWALTALRSSLAGHARRVCNPMPLQLLCWSFGDSGPISDTDDLLIGPLNVGALQAGEQDMAATVLLAAPQGFRAQAVRLHVQITANDYGYPGLCLVFALDGADGPDGRPLSDAELLQRYSECDTWKPAAVTDAPSKRDQGVWPHSDLIGWTVVRDSFTDSDIYVELEMTLPKKFILIKYLCPHGGTGIKVQGSRLHGSLRSESECWPLGPPGWVDGRPLRSAELVEATLRFLLLVQDDLGAISERDPCPFLDVSDLTIEPFWLLYSKLLPSHSAESTAARILLLRLLRCLGPVLATHDLMGPDKEAARACLAEFYRHLCDAVDKAALPPGTPQEELASEGTLKELETAERRQEEETLSGATAVFFPGEEAREKLFTMLGAPSRDEERLPKSVSLTLRSLCSRFSKFPELLCPLPPPSATQPQRSEPLLRVIHTLLDLAQTQQESGRRWHEPPALLQLLVEVQRQHMSWCHLALKGGKQGVADVARAVMLAYVKRQVVMAVASLTALASLPSDRFADSVSHLQHSFVAVATRHLLAFLLELVDLEFPCTLQQELMPLVTCLFDLANRHKGYFKECEEQDAGGGGGESVVLGRWLVEFPTNAATFLCPGAHSFTIEFDKRSPTYWNSCMEFMDGHGAYLRFSDNYNEEQLLMGVTMKCGPTLLFQQHGSEMYYRFTVTARGAPHDYPVPWLHDLHLLSLRLLGRLHGAEVATTVERAPAADESEKQKPCMLGALGATYWSEALHLAGVEYTAAPADKQVHELLLALASARGSKAGLALLSACEGGAARGGAGGAGATDAIEVATRAVFAALLHHTRPLWQQLVPYAAGEVAPAADTEDLRWIHAQARTVRNWLLAQRQDSVGELAEEGGKEEGGKEEGGKEEDGKEEGGKEEGGKEEGGKEEGGKEEGGKEEGGKEEGGKEEGGQKMDSLAEMSIRKCLFLLKLPPVNFDPSCDFISGVRNTAPDSCEDPASGSAGAARVRPPVREERLYPWVGDILAFVKDKKATPDGVLQAVTQQAALAHKRAASLARVNASLRSALYDLEMVAPALAFLQGLLAHQLALPRYPLEGVRTCGPELAAAMQERYRELLGTLAQTLRLPSLHADSSRVALATAALHLLCLDWEPSEASLLMEAELPEILVGIALGTTATVLSLPCESADAAEELAAWEKEQRWLQEFSSDSADWLRQLHDAKPDKCKKTFLVKYGERLHRETLCSACRSLPLHGCFRCLQCTDCTLCTDCFVGGVKPSGHDSSHELLRLEAACASCRGLLLRSRVSCFSCPDLLLCLGCQTHSNFPPGHTAQHAVDTEPSAVFLTSDESGWPYLQTLAWHALSVLALRGTPSGFASRLPAPSARCAQLLIQRLRSTGEEEQGDEAAALVRQSRQQRILGLLAAMLPPPMEPLPEALSPLVPLLLDAVSPRSGWRSGPGVPHMALALLGRTLPFVAPAQADSAMAVRAAAAMTTARSGAPPPDGWAALAHLIGLGATVTNGTGRLDWASAITAILHALAAQPRWSPALCSFCSDRLSCLPSDLSWDNISYLLLTAIPSELRVLGLGMLAQREDASGHRQDVVAVRRFTEKRESVVVDCRTRLFCKVDDDSLKLAPLGRAPLDVVMAAPGVSEHTERLLLFTGIAGLLLQRADKPPSLPPQKIVGATEGVALSYNESLVLALSLKAILHLLQSSQDGDAQGEALAAIFRSSLLPQLGPLALRGTGLSTAWLLPELQMLSLMQYLGEGDPSEGDLSEGGDPSVGDPGNSTVTPSAKPAEEQDPKGRPEEDGVDEDDEEEEEEVDSAGASPVDPLEDLPEPTKVLLKLCRDSLGAEPHDLRALWERHSSLLHSFALELHKQLGGSSLMGGEEEGVARGAPADASASQVPWETHVDRGVVVLPTKPVPGVCRRAVPYSAVAAVSVAVCSEEPVLTATAAKIVRQRSAQLLQQALQPRKGATSGSTAGSSRSQITHAFATLCARHMISHLLSHWSAFGVRAVHEALGLAEPSHMAYLLDILLKQDGPEKLQKILEEVVPHCDPPLLEALALTAARFLAEPVVVKRTRESPHPYPNGYKREESLYFPGAAFLSVCLHPCCSTGSTNDQLIVSTVPTHDLHRHERCGPADYWQPFSIAGDMLCYKFTGSRQQDWGYQFTVVAKSYGLFYAGFAILRAVVPLVPRVAGELWAWVAAAACGNTGEQRLQAVHLLQVLLEVLQHERGTCHLQHLRPLWCLLLELEEHGTGDGAGWEHREQEGNVPLRRRLLPQLQRALTDLFYTAERCALEQGLEEEYLRSVCAEDSAKPGDVATTTSATTAVAS